MVLSSRGIAARRAALLGPVALLALVSCTTPPPPPEPGPRPTVAEKPTVVVTDPALFKSSVTASNDEFIVTDTVAIHGGDDETTFTELREKAIKRAVEMTVRDILRDDARYAERQRDIDRLLIDQFSSYYESDQTLQRVKFGDGTQLGLKLRVKIARSKVQAKLQAEAILRTAKMKTILVLRKPATEAAEAADLAKDYLDDLGDTLSRELGERGFQPKLWQAVRRSIAERRDAGDKDLELTLRTFVEESDWRKQEDEKYVLPMLLLRSEGRLLVGFRILELEKRELAYHVTMRADAYDLLNDTSFGYEVDSGRAPIGDRTLLEARQALVTETANRLMARIATRLTDRLEQDRRRNQNRRDYTFTFTGWGPADTSRIETMMAGIVAEDIDSSSEGKSIVVRAAIDRDPIPVRDEIARALKLLGLRSQPAQRNGFALTFVKDPAP